ncbi:zinc-dependent peptidase [Propionivibrio limicola]|uniref:M90 family metallopeptidase n=1 Tax=Propionivibrio limicola TaxID=167645 RepID=UPI0012923966|nr:M90 family metallopeptidase [Propionivibrio limicola]
MFSFRQFLRQLQGKNEPPPLPDRLWHETLAALPFLDRLSDEEKMRLRQLTEKFLAEKEFSGAGGLQITDAMCVSIAAQGCLLVLNLGLSYYRDWVGIIVYPDEFVVPRSVEDDFGVVHEYDDVASGEAWSGGPLLISWHDVQLAGEGYNVVIHEFAHKIDMRNGEADGFPPLPANDLSRKEWGTTFSEAYEDFCRRVDVAERRGDELVLDHYAAEDPAEFFAVMTETFFDMPELLRREYPDIYGLLSRFYRQSP